MGAGCDAADAGRVHAHAASMHLQKHNTPMQSYTVLHATDKSLHATNKSLHATPMHPTPMRQGWRPVWSFPIDKVRAVESMLKDIPGLTVSAESLPQVVHKVLAAAARLPDDTARYDRLKEVRRAGRGLASRAGGCMSDCAVLVCLMAWQGCWIPFESSVDHNEKY